MDISLLVLVILSAIVLIIAFLGFFFFVSQKNTLRFRQLEQTIQEGIQSGIEKRSEQQREEADRFYNTIFKAINDTGQRNNESFQKLREELDKKVSTFNEKVVQSQQDLSKGLQLGLKNINETTGKIGEKFSGMTKFDENIKQVNTSMLNLNKVLMNVKQLGMFGEYQLEAMISEVFPEGFYEKQVMLSNQSQDKVDFVLKIPNGAENTVSLPIDAKFSLEPYKRLLAAREELDENKEKEAYKELIAFVRKSGKDMQRKYLDPPRTTEFAILFIPQESIFLEIAKDSPTVEEMRKSFHIIITGPSTFHGLLSTLLLGFRSFALAEKSREILELFGIAFTEIKRFSQSVEQALKKNKSAELALETLQKRTQLIEKRFDAIQKSPVKEFPSAAASTAKKGAEREIALDFPQEESENSPTTHEIEGNNHFSTENETIDAEKEDVVELPSLKMGAHFQSSKGSQNNPAENLFS